MGCIKVIQDSACIIRTNNTPLLKAPFLASKEEEKKNALLLRGTYYRRAGNGLDV
jgi:hypothetical protein